MSDMTPRGDAVGGDKVGGDKIAAGHIENSVVAIGRGASVSIRYYPIELRALLRRNFDPLIQDRLRLFAGRERELQRIVQFIEDEAGGFLVITAPNGFGKTALMANLIHAKPEAFAYHLFYPPYTETLDEPFFLRNIMEQLSHWYQHAPWYDAEHKLPDDAAELRALYYKFLQEPLAGTQLLILDGLDAVRGWELSRYLSTPLPPNFHMILTLEEGASPWRTALGLPLHQVVHLPLPGLSRGEVAEVLRAAGGKAAARADETVLLDEVVRRATSPAHATLGVMPARLRPLAEALARGEPLPLLDDVALSEPGGDGVGRGPGPLDARPARTVWTAGARGDHVREWQTFLQQQGYDLNVDGLFGPGTQRATMAFQRQQGLPADGIVGRQTLEKARQLGQVPDKNPAARSEPGPVPDKRTLRDKMIGAFNLEELADICADVEAEFAEAGQDIRVNLDMIPGSTLSAKVRELIGYLERRGHLEVLVRVVRAHRPGLV